MVIMFYFNIFLERIEGKIGEREVRIRTTMYRTTKKNRKSCIGRVGSNVCSTATSGEYN
jgi:hypothetical protein